MLAIRTRQLLLGGFAAIAVTLYLYGVLSAAHIPATVDAVALPLDFMVGIPLMFYFMVVRRAGGRRFALFPSSGSATG